MRWWQREREQDLERELRADLELEAEELRERGLSPEEALYAARRAFGNTTWVKEEVREMWGWTLLSQLGQDLRYALRAIRGNRAFSAAVILSLALGIGANAAIFTIINALLLRALPVRNPSELVQLLLVQSGKAVESFGYPAIGALAERTDIFDGVCGFSGGSFNIDSRDGRERVAGAWVSGGFYATLGLEPFAGRLLTAGDDKPGAPPVAVLSYSYWENRLNRDFGLVGRVISIEGRPVTIVGISPKGFTGANVGDAANLTLPLAALAQLLPSRAPQLDAGPLWLRMLARPRPGLSVAQAKARIAVVWPGIAPLLTHPRMTAERRQVVLNSSVDLIPGGTGFSGLRNQFRKPLLVLLAVTGLVLLIACANFANLLLARGAARSKEIALRFAIGAGRWRIVRQLLTESVVLSLMGAALGLAFAGVGSRVLVTLLSDTIVLDLRPDAGILLFTIAAALATGIVFGLVPALRVTAARPALRNRSRLLPTLVVSQVALSLVLLIGAGLFVRTLENLQHLDPGFRSEGVLVLEVDGPRAGYKDGRLAGLYGELLNRFEHLPGVASASIAENTPFGGMVWSEPVAIDGQPPTKESSTFNRVAPRFFETMGTPLVLGRDFDERDRPGAVPAAIVNEAFARKYLTGAPIGKRLSVANTGYSEPFEIVGVVKDAASKNLREPHPPSVYLPYFAYPGLMSSGSFVVRVQGSLSQTANLIREELRAKFPGTPVQFQLQPLDEQVQRTLVQERMLAALGSCFGALALLLAAVGIYGLLAYAVTRSTREIGIRVALGAKRTEVLELVFGNALRLLALGIVAGIPAAWAAARLVRTMLFGLTLMDPLTIVGATVLLGATALIAALFPALRASRIHPTVALRYE